MTTTKKVQAIMKAADLSTITPAEISRQLHISDTTLRRRLRREKTHFAKLLMDEKKWRCAEALAGNPYIGLTELAETCDYSHPSSMQRAFIAWYGETITHWRERVAP